MTNNFQKRIDKELGEPKWNDNLSRAIQRRAMELEPKQPQKTMPVFVPFVSMAMLTILVLLALSYFPMWQQGDQAADREMKFQQMYYSKMHADSYIQAGQPNLWTVGMDKTTDAALLQQLSTAYEQLQEIKEPKTENARLKSVILYDEMNVAYPYNIYKTYTNELLFENVTSQTFYKYSGPETDVIFEFIDKPYALKKSIITLVVFIILFFIAQYTVLRYYGVKRRKETFDDITLERLFRWAPIPYLLYINFKFASRPLTLTWWEIVVPFLFYQIVQLILMKQQKEPHAYIVEQMVMSCIALLFIIVNMWIL